MNNPLTSIIIIIVAGMLGFSYALPEYKEIAVLEETNSELEDAILRANEVEDTLEEYELIVKDVMRKKSEVRRMNVILPEEIDQVTFANNLHNLALRHLMVTSDITFSEIGTSPQDSEDEQYDVLRRLAVNFNVKNTYEGIVLFLKDVEKSLELVNISSVNIVAGGLEVGDNPDDVPHEYTIELIAYFMKQKHE